MMMMLKSEKPMRFHTLAFPANPSLAGYKLLYLLQIINSVQPFQRERVTSLVLSPHIGPEGRYEITPYLFVLCLSLHLTPSQADTFCFRYN